MTVLTRPVMEINLANLVENYQKLAKIIAPATPSAVVKDDAYGIGAQMIAQTLYERAGCRDFWVAHAVSNKLVIMIMKFLIKSKI